MFIRLSGSKPTLPVSSLNSLNPEAMTDRKLTPGQIEELHEFCYFRTVRHYDVQVEIVDHLASAIEKIWETNPTLPFDEAMYQVGEQFGGDLGFATIKQEKEKALRKNN